MALADLAVVAGDARTAASQFGYTRMWSIHPDQIRPILAAFSPDHGEVDEAVAILSQAQACDWGPIQHEGKLHDRASYRYYWTVLQKAKHQGQALPASLEALT